MHRSAARSMPASAWTDNMRSIIETSHRRSIDYGLQPESSAELNMLARSDLSVLIEQNRQLHAHAVPAMETLYQQIANTHNMVILTDAAGVIVHTLGDDDFLEKANRVALKPGVAWSEACRGTNAIGTAIAEKSPALVHADQHYLAANHFLTCSAAPITDYKGNVIGVLDVSGDQRSFHKHTMALVRMSALMIENQLFAANFEDAITLHFHTRPEFIGTLMEGIASFTPGGRFLAANRNGLFQLGLPFSALQAHSVSSLFGLPVSGLYEHYRTATPGLLDLCMHNGVRVHGRAQLRLSNSVFQSVIQEQPAPACSASPPAAPTPQTRRLSGLRYLRTGDAQLELVIDKVSRVLGHAIPIMIMGETGTGKELLAQAIHQDSPRASKPFMAVNCASIPETLIESELFGYEDGAFTGARKKGAMGKLLQANGGTLFLDEIGDMPFSLQARLLRVLQERVVTPLGSDKSIPVDLEVICATNHNLRQRMAGGLFREDLYYRLNGLVVKLPPLRERSDLEAVVRKILASEAHHARHRVAPELLALFQRHRWPGNLRQLTNLLRTAIVMAGTELEIGLHHMPDDFMEDIMDNMKDATAAPAHGASTSTERPLIQGGKLEDLAQSMISASLQAHGGNVAATARALGISRNTIYRKLKALP